MTRREFDAATRRLIGVFGRYFWIVDPIDRLNYRHSRGHVKGQDRLAERAEILGRVRAEGEPVPALCARADWRAWRRLWLARDRRTCPRRPEHERQDYADRLEEADLRQRFPLTRETR